ncbi:MAG TPA: zf-HC2 domain-containing protein [Anaerolineales bacterium]|nr:zf-HC2 domain-containing protein [Anaerolineales bacterium]
MSKHVTEWLNAYLDGELRGSRLQHVAAHLAECPACQAELGSLERLSGFLHEVPAPEFPSPERFTCQVNLRLPHRQTSTSGNRILEIGWWMIPVGLLGAWIFISTSFLVSDLLSAANNLGLLTSISDWLVFSSSNQAYWSATLGQFGVLSGSTLDLAASTETFTRTSLPQISLQVSIALLYMSWIAIWWAHHTRHQRQQPGQLLEG